VSFLDPLPIADVLDVPARWVFVGYFCLGTPAAESDTPELERQGWEHRRAPEMFRLRR